MKIADALAEGITTDVHLYLDFSGINSAEHHLDAVRRIVGNLVDPVEIYVTTFNHEVGETLHIGASTDSLEDTLLPAIQAIRDTGGGTDFNKVWDHIQDSPERREQFSVISSDLLWWAGTPDEFKIHPANLYYIENAMAEERHRKDFIQSMRGELFDPELHILS